MSHGLIFPSIMAAAARQSAAASFLEREVMLGEAFHPFAGLHCLPSSDLVALRWRKGGEAFQDVTPSSPPAQQPPHQMIREARFIKDALGAFQAEEGLNYDVEFEFSSGLIIPGRVTVKTGVFFERRPVHMDVGDSVRLFASARFAADESLLSGGAVEILDADGNEVLAKTAVSPGSPPDLIANLRSYEHVFTSPGHYVGRLYASDLPAGSPPAATERSGEIRLLIS